MGRGRPRSCGEGDLFEATEALREGKQEAVVARYLDDAGHLLKLLSDLFDPPRGDKAAHRFRFVPRPKKLIKKAEEDWDGDFWQVREAIQNGHEALVGDFLRDLRKFLKSLSASLDPEDPRDCRLSFVRKGRGRRVDPQQRSKDAAIARELKFAKLKRGKQEAGVADVAERRGIARSTIFRAKSGSRTKPT
jgi:hypothetical protein